MLLRRIAPSAPTGAIGSITPTPALSATTSQPSTEGSPSTSCISPWILDSGASFHMTSDRTCLSAICPSPIPLIVQTTNGSSLLIVGHGTLSSSSFHVPSVCYVPKLTMQLFSAGQLTDHGCRVILDSNSCCV
jgi:hypothetical protein